MIIKRANEQELEFLIETYPISRQVLCTWDNNSYTLIAKNGDQLIAYASVFRREIPAPLKGETEDFINAIDIIIPELRGTGIGSMLVDEIKRTAKQSGSIQVRAYCDIKNVASHALWSKNGFGISPVKNSDGTILGSFVTFRL